MYIDRKKREMKFFQLNFRVALVACHPSPVLLHRFGQSNSDTVFFPKPDSLLQTTTASLPLRPLTFGMNVALPFPPAYLLHRHLQEDLETYDGIAAGKSDQQCRDRLHTEAFV